MRYMRCVDCRLCCWEMINNLDELQDVGVKGFTMWKDEVKGLDLKHALKVVEIQARWGDTILPFTAVSF